MYTVDSYFTEKKGKFSDFAALPLPKKAEIPQIIGYVANNNAGRNQDFSRKFPRGGGGEHIQLS